MSNKPSSNETQSSDNLKTYLLPTLGVTVEAKDADDAVKKAQKLSKKQEEGNAE